MIKQHPKYRFFSVWTISILFLGTMLVNSLHYLVIAHSGSIATTKPHVQNADHCLICDFTFGASELPNQHWSISLFYTPISKVKRYVIVNRVSKIINQQFKRGPPSV